VPYDSSQQTSFCLQLVIGPTLPSPDGKWTVAIESSDKPLLYEGEKLPMVPYDKYGTEGRVIGNNELFILFTKVVTGEKKEMAIVDVVSPGIFTLLKNLDLNSVPGIESEIIKWSSDGRELWGQMKLIITGEYCARFETQRTFLFAVDTSNWRATLYSMRDGIAVGTSSDMLNADRKLVLYSDERGTSTLSLNIYNLTSGATTTLASFSKYKEPVAEIGPRGDVPSCEGDGLRARWINSSTVSWVDPQTGKTATGLVL
jgi:hypothetical protein